MFIASPWISNTQDTWWSDGNIPHDIDHEAADAKGVSYRLAACWDVGLEPDEEKSLLDWPLMMPCLPFFLAWGVWRCEKRTQTCKIHQVTAKSWGILCSSPHWKKNDFGAQYIRCTNWMSFRFFRVGPSMQPSEVALSLQSICALIWLLEWNLRKVELHVLMRESKENDHRTTDHRDSCTLKPGRNESMNNLREKGWGLLLGRILSDVFVLQKRKTWFPYRWLVASTEAATSEKLKPSFAFRPIKHARIAPSTLVSCEGITALDSFQDFECKYWNVTSVSVGFGDHQGNFSLDATPLEAELMSTCSCWFLTVGGRCQRWECRAHCPTLARSWSWGRNTWCASLLTGRVCVFKKATATLWVPATHECVCGKDFGETTVIPHLRWRSPCGWDHHRIPGLWRWDQYTSSTAFWTGLQWPNRYDFCTDSQMVLLLSL